MKNKILLSVIALAVITGVILVIVMQNKNNTLSSAAIQAPDTTAEETITPSPQTSAPLSEEERKKIEARIEALQAEIVAETHDADRAINLRIELENMQSKLQ